MGIETKYKNLKENIQKLKKIAVAYSGGLDSTFLLKVCRDVLGADNVIAVSAKTDLQAKRENEGSAEFIAKEKISHYAIEFYDYFDLACFRENPPDRCYYCKKEIFLKIIDLADKKGFAIVADGTNADDIKDYRPGGRAIKELNVKSPLLEAGLTKEEIRALSKRLGLHNHDRPSPACLATRFPCGTAITPERIEMVNAAENCLFDLGFEQFRVRYHGDVARIEVSSEEIRRFFDFEFMQEIASKIKEAGFLYVSLDLNGYKMGGMNEKI
ncbi:MAG: ATP-dependent sacrificial sulfur transferase LarE [Oscillospiraceae bacterium]|nr:ATP-dependent sacrificial sulfur transferase LarE [Oscillospiraceae bacterium]